MSDHHHDTTPWFLVPIVLLWKFLSIIMERAGRVLTSVTGILLTITGIYFAVSSMAAPLGIPLIIFGLIIILRSIY